MYVNYLQFSIPTPYKHVKKISNHNGPNLVIVRHIVIYMLVMLHELAVLSLG